MQAVILSDGRRLQSDIEQLGRELPSMENPCGLRQRAKSAFLKQLHAFKCEQLEQVEDAMRHSGIDSLRRSDRVRKI